MERGEVRELTGKILSSRALDSDARNLALNTCAALEGFSSTEELRKAADDGAREGYLHPEVAEVMRTLSYIAQYVLPTLARRAAGESGESAASSPAGDGSASEPTGGAGSRAPVSEATLRNKEENSGQR